MRVILWFIKKQREVAFTNCTLKYIS